MHLVESSTGEQLTTWRPHGLQRPVSLVVVEGGTSIFVLDQVKSQVFRLDTQGDVVGMIGYQSADDHGFFEPKEVLAAGDHLWVFDFGNRRIVATSYDGDVLNRLGEEFVRAG